MRVRKQQISFALSSTMFFVLLGGGCVVETQNTEDENRATIQVVGGGSAPGNSAKSANRPCAEYPTIAGIDCSAFPRDAGNAQSTAGNNFYVSTTGNDSNSGTSPAQAFKSIGRALGLAKSNSLIHVAPGSYSEGEADDYRALIFDNDNVVLRAEAGGEVKVSPSTKEIKYGIQINASNIIVDGINLNGFTSALVNLESGIKDVVLKNMKLTAGESDSVDGIVAPDEKGMDGLLIRNVRIEKANLGISCNVGPCRNWWIDNVTVIGPGGGGDSGADAIASEVRNENAPESEISSNWLITNVEVTGAGGDGIDMKAARVAVFNANVHDNARNGVKFWRGGDLVNSLVVNHGADAAVVFDRAGTYRVLNSLIAYENFGAGRSYTMTVGYDLQNDPIKLSVVNTIFFNNSGSIHLSAGTKATIQNCLLGNTDTNEVIVKGDIAITEGNDTSELSRLSDASGNLPFKTDPMFSNPPTDFTFGIDSPLVDSGITTSRFPDFDFSGNPRIKGKAADIGPLELF